jgi:hypothetical protein
LKDSSVFGKIFSSQSDRGNYTPSKAYLSYFILYFGVGEENLYNLEIYKTNYNIENRKDIALFTDTIPNPSDFDLINYFKDGLKNYRNSLEELDLEIIKNEEINLKIKRAMDLVLDEEKSEFANDRVKQNFIIKIMSWIKEYIGELNIDKNDPPKVVFYGDAKKHELLFMLTLHLSGFDILYLNPNSKADTIFLKPDKHNIEIEEGNIVDEVISFEDRNEMGEKVDKGSIKKAYTIGAEASKRISEELLNESGFIKPWQLQDRMIKNLLLSTTVDEISIYWNEPSKLRPGFKFDSNIVDMPVFLSKIDGIYSDKMEYVEFIDKLRNSTYTYFIEYNGYTNVFAREFIKNAFSLSFLLSTDVKLDKKPIINNQDYTISTLSIQQQIMILEKVEELFEGNMFIEGLNIEDKIRGLYTVLHMDKQFVRMINNFDYSGINPKLVLYIGKSFLLSKEICFLIILLSKIGFDIIILSPGGENTVENIINSSLIDRHRLDRMEYDMRLNDLNEDVPLFKKLFGKRRKY